MLVCQVITFRGTNEGETKLKTGSSFEKYFGMYANGSVIKLVITFLFVYLPFVKKGKKKWYSARIFI